MKKNHLLKNLLLSLLIPCAVLAVLKIIALAKGGAPGADPRRRICDSPDSAHHCVPGYGPVL